MQLHLALFMIHIGENGLMDVKMCLLKQIAEKDLQFWIVNIATFGMMNTHSQSVVVPIHGVLAATLHLITWRE